MKFLAGSGCAPRQEKETRLQLSSSTHPGQGFGPR